MKKQSLVLALAAACIFEYAAARNTHYVATTDGTPKVNLLADTIPSQKRPRKTPTTPNVPTPTNPAPTNPTPTNPMPTTPTPTNPTTPTNPNPTPTPVPPTPTPTNPTPTRPPVQ